MATRKEYDGYDAATSIKSNDLIKYKDGTSGTVYKITEANLSAQVQADLFDNDAATEVSDVATALSVVEEGGTISRITLQDLMIQMKGYKEYRFSVSQPAEDTPTISVVVDDFSPPAPLSCADTGTQYVYTIDVSSLGVTLGSGVDIKVLSSCALLPIKIEAIDSSTLQLTTHETTTDDYTEALMTSAHGCEIIIKENL